MWDVREILAENLPKALVERVPELAQAMAQEAAFWDDYGIASIGPDTTFGLVLAPFVIERLKCEEGGTDSLLQRIFGFLEDLTYSKNDDVLSAIDVSFGEELLADADALKKAENYMGPRLRETFELLRSRRDSLPSQKWFR